MRCYSCNAPGNNMHDSDTDRFYCGECWVAIRVNAYENNDEGLTTLDASDSIDSEAFKKETGIDVNPNASRLPALWSQEVSDDF